MKVKVVEVKVVKVNLVKVHKSETDLGRVP